MIREIADVNAPSRQQCSSHSLLPVRSPRYRTSRHTQCCSLILSLGQETSQPARPRLDARFPDVLTRAPGRRPQVTARPHFREPRVQVIWPRSCPSTNLPQRARRTTENERRRSAFSSASAVKIISKPISKCADALRPSVSRPRTVRGSSATLPAFVASQPRTIYKGDTSQSPRPPTRGTRRQAKSPNPAAP